MQAQLQKPVQFLIWKDNEKMLLTKQIEEFLKQLLMTRIAV